MYINNTTTNIHLNHYNYAKQFTKVPLNTVYYWNVMLQILENTQFLKNVPKIDKIGQHNTLFKTNIQLYYIQYMGLDYYKQ